MPSNIPQNTEQPLQQTHLRNLAADRDSTVPGMLTATSVLFPSQDLFSSRLTRYFYSGHHCDYTES